jgi:hypothetical protein
MIRFKTIVVTLTVISLGILFTLQTGCKKDDEEGTASFSVSLKSTNAARAIYNEVNIDIQSASIHTSTNPDETGGWFELPTYTGIYDLLDYEAGNDTIIALAPFLEVQTVSQIRLILGDANTIIVDGVTYDLDTPSAQTSGLKIQIHAELQPNLAYKVVLNFDVDKSIVKTGNDNYKLTPVINATVVQVP